MINWIMSLFFKLATIAATLLGIIILSTYFYLLHELPEVETVDQSKLQIPLKIYTSDGKLIGEFGEKKRVYPVIADAILSGQRVRVKYIDYDNGVRLS